MEVRPFKGIFYNKKKVHDISSVISPPYDVISESEQERLYYASDRNYVRVVLGKQQHSDTPADNRYTRAAQFLNKWLEDGTLVEDEAKSLYIYEQEFVHKKRRFFRKGFLGLMKIEQSGVKVHENTFKKHKDDRLQLMKATGANTEPIFVLYNGEDVAVPDTEPLICVKDDIGTVHRIWPVSEEEAVNEFIAQFKGKKTYIADGHHRYETAADYAAELKIKPGSKDQRNYILTYFVESQDSGLLVLPTHRVLNISAEDENIILNTAKKYFLNVEVDGFEKVERSPGHVFGFFSRRTGKMIMLKLRDVVAKEKIMSLKKQDALKDLDVAILHSLLLDDVLEKYKDKKTEDVIAYVHDENEAVSMVKKGKYSCAMLLKPAKVTQIMDIADRGGRMPQKSTYFYPKPYSGLVLRKFE